MKKRAVNRSVRTLFLALASLLVVSGLAACGSQDSASPISAVNTSQPSSTPTSQIEEATRTVVSGAISAAGVPTSQSHTTPQASPQAQTMTLSVYFMRDEKIAAAQRELPKEPQVASAAMEALLAGPTEEERAVGMTTAIPDGTRYLGTDIDGTTATVDLSGEFESGGGSLAVTSRLAQVVYTLTQFSTIEDVRFLLDGEPVAVFGSEGLIMDHPVGRSNYEEITPAILVESPVVGAEVASPLRVQGTANTFEAMFMLQILESDGTVLIEEPVTATSGSGTRGTFDVTLRFDAAPGTEGTLRVFEHSAKDGSPINVVEIPITFSTVQASS